MSGADIGTHSNDRAVQSREVFVTGGTGYLGSRLITRLQARGHKIHALVRKESVAKLPQGCRVVEGNALELATFAGQIQPADTFVQLLGVSHPSPSKGAQFRAVDLVSIRASVAAAVEAGIRHFVYVSVAQPAPVMKEYVAVRAEGEALLRTSGLDTTVLRPWYVLGPGHWWPSVLLPIYWLASALPGTRESARRLGLVTLNQMLAALISVVEDPARGFRVLEVPEIREATHEQRTES
jgi:uncharacterized protein YbjT (DUF2867 family)